MVDLTLYYTLDTQGNPQPAASTTEWGQWFQRSWPARKVAQVVLPLDCTHRLFVSTVFLSMDHNFLDGQDTRPILYETMVFYEEFRRPRGRGPVRTRVRRLYRAKRALETPYQRRYRTKADARADFDKLVTYLVEMKAAWDGTPSQFSVEAWCNVYDILDEEERSQTENRSALHSDEVTADE